MDIVVPEYAELQNELAQGVPEHIRILKGRNE